MLRKRCQKNLQVFKKLLCVLMLKVAKEIKR